MHVWHARIVYQFQRVGRVGRVMAKARMAMRRSHNGNGYRWIYAQWKKKTACSLLVRQGRITPKP